MGNSVLIVEDDEILADNVREYLSRNQWEARVFHTAEQALKALESTHPDVILTDQMLPGKSGLELLDIVTATEAGIKVVVMTAVGDVHCAVDAMKAGAYDYLTKPVVLAELKLLLDKAIGVARMERNLSFYQRAQSRDAGLASLLGASPAMERVRITARRVLDAESRMPAGDLPAVMISGETGTGKELAARALHFDGGRREGPFVEINCASIPSALLEAELFGHQKGAFTDAKDHKIGLAEAAEGGTLFLDEIGEVELALQGKLLKLLEDKTIRRVGSVRERKVNLRIISATNRDLEKMVAEGRFRSDLYFRLHIITLRMPPLRERGDDILLLARHFLAMHARRYGRRKLGFSPAAERFLLAYSWPGNVRELRNVLEQTVLLAQGEVIEPEDLMAGRGSPLEVRSEPQARNGSMGGAMGTMARAGAEPDEPEREVLVRALEKNVWNVSRVARLLGLSRDMLRYRIEKYGLARPAE